MKKASSRLRVEDVRRRNLRRIKSETQQEWKEIAKLLGMSPSRLSHIMSGHRAFTEKTARDIEQQLKLTPLSLDRDGKSHSVERVTDSAFREGVQQAVIAALSAMGRSDLERTERYERIVEFAYDDAKERGAVDAARIGRLVGEILRE